MTENDAAQFYNDQRDCGWWYCGGTALQQNLTNTANPPTTIPERVLGRTGIQVPIFGLGGAGRSWNEAESDAVAIIQRARTWHSLL